MTVPQSTNPVWEDLITGKKVVSFEFLAVKIFIGAAQNAYKHNPSVLPELASNLHQLFEKNQNLPSAQNDLAKI